MAALRHLPPRALSARGRPRDHARLLRRAGSGALARGRLPPPARRRADRAARQSGRGGGGALGAARGRRGRLLAHGFAHGVARRGFRSRADSGRPRQRSRGPPRRAAGRGVHGPVRGARPDAAPHGRPLGHVLHPLRRPRLAAERRRLSDLGGRRALERAGNGAGRGGHAANGQRGPRRVAVRLRAAGMVLPLSDQLSDRI